MFDALRAACLVPIEHYGLNVGQLRVGDPADFIEVDSLTEFNVLRTWIDGRQVAEQGRTTIPRVEPQIVNHFVASHVKPADFAVPATPDSTTKLQVIEALDGQLITNQLSVTPKITDGHLVSDVERDVLKLVVVKRYHDCSRHTPYAVTGHGTRSVPAALQPAIAFIKNVGLRRGAIASSVAHDSHNVIAVGVDDADIAAAVNLVMESRGGLSAACVADGVAEVLPLPVAGLMATGTCEEVGTAYAKLDKRVKAWGSTLRSPYMTLSFMALLVIPALKLSDRGLFDGSRFEFTELLA
jgi:adenine deaminase